jgi:hypothetical protein
VVAELPSQVVWYNDIEDGFNVSPFVTRGVIGSYFCNQDSFAEFLARLPEARAAEDLAEQRADASTLAVFAGRGRIGRRQTTYWDFHADDDGATRAHFSGKQEARFSQAAYDRVTLAVTHPLLLDYEEPWQALFVTNAHHCSHQLIDEIDVAVSGATHGWRGASEYLGASASTKTPSELGVFFLAPRTVD